MNPREAIGRLLHLPFRRETKESLAPLAAKFETPNIDIPLGTYVTGSEMETGNHYGGVLMGLNKDGSAAISGETGDYTLGGHLTIIPDTALAGNPQIMHHVEAKRVALLELLNTKPNA